jgi:MOSC domain-containing protein YiiM
VPHVVEVRTGRVGSVRHRDRDVATAIDKVLRIDRVAVGPLGLAGDEQADRRVHGGPDKAICVYAAEHYPWWREHLGIDLDHGAFGENLLVHGLTEDEVEVGDRFVVGAALVEVSMPRRPCYKLGARHGRTDMPDLLQETGRTGFYLRVLRPGAVAAGDLLRPVEASRSGVTVAELNRVMNVDKDDLVAAERLSRVPAVPEKWRQSLVRRLEGQVESDASRLRG